MFTIPKINGEILKNNSEFILKGNLTINKGVFNLGSITVFLNRIYENCNIKGDIINNDGAAVKLSIDSSYSKEGYGIEIKADGITLYASCDSGMKWALATLYQMFVEAQKKNNGILQGSFLKDWPKYSHRGLSLDVCRHFFDVEEVKRIIEEMSVNKLNVLHWHITEDQGWRIESKVFPKLNEIGSCGKYYTQEQIRDIVEFANNRGVEIIPEIDMPGHASAAIASYSELSCFDEKVEITENAGIFKVIMCAGKESTYEWIFKLMDEIVELFPSNRIHLGGDEAPKGKWQECPHCNKYMENHNIENYEDLQGAFTGRIAEYLKSKGKKVTCWNESLKAKEISKDITVQYWMEAAMESYVYPHFEKGQPMIFSNMFNMYFDYPTCVVSLRKTYEFEPEMMGDKNLKGDNILGIEGAMWTERVPTNEILESMISPRIQALSEAAWTVDRNYEDFLIRLKAHLNELDIVKLMSVPFEQATVSGEEAKNQAIGFLQGFLGVLQSGDIDMGLSKEELNGMLMMFIFNIFEGATAMEVAKNFGLM